jgi:hypothetical protein
MIEYVKPNGVVVEINEENATVEAAQALGWKPKPKAKPGPKPKDKADAEE